VKQEKANKKWHFSRITQGGNSHFFNLKPAFPVPHYRFTNRNLFLDTIQLIRPSSKITLESLGMTIPLLHCALEILNWELTQK